MPQGTWTKEQWDAITARGSTLLVSAAAGSGKTAVLTQRVVDILSDAEHPVRADRLLIATFSNAAAEEMKSRIEASLNALSEQEPGNGYLREQAFELQNAFIGTVHAFCMGLIRDHFQLLGLGADMRIADERELLLLREQTLEELVQERYEEGDPCFFQTVELFSSSKNDRRLLNAVLRLYDFTRSHPFPDEWLEEKLRLYEPGVPVGETPWGQEIFAYAADALEYSLGELRRAMEVIREDEKLQKAYQDAFWGDEAQLSRVLEAVQARDWDGTISALRSVSFGRLRPLRGYEDEALKERLKGVRSRCKDLIEEMRQRQFCADSAQFIQDLEDLRPKIGQLFSLVRDFSERFSALKLERQILDFSDLEQYALRLLVDDLPGAGHAPSALSAELKEAYDYILVDEYQDTNEAQETIFSSLSRGDNLFMVGDVKQSIYGFRQANPRIFMAKKEAFPYYAQHAPQEKGPYKIVLGANFRSHPAVCGAINAVFSACMSRRVGEIIYNEDEQLSARGSFLENRSAGVSLEVLDISGGEDAAQAEARYVAGRIARILEEGTLVNDKGVLRPACPGDIGILLRSPQSRAETYLKALAQVGVRAVSGAQSSFFGTLEIGAVLSLLRAVNNPLLDIPLVSAMMSPLFALSAGDVARIRLYQKNAPYYLAMVEGEKQGDRDCIRVLEELRELRRTASSVSVSRLLEALYERTGILSLVSALEHADQRRANLHLLREYVCGYERAGYRTLSQLVRFFDRLEENGEDLQPAAIDAPGRESVQIMSIHRSKGLEFPIVFLCDCAKRFNRDDLRQNVLLHSQLGFACVRRNEENMSQHTTVPLEALKLRLQSELASEEMRILYVALTRAKETLILTGAAEKLGGRIASLDVGCDGEGRLPSYAVAGAQNMLDWLLMAALTLPDGEPLREYAGLPGGRGGEGGILCCRVAAGEEAGGPLEGEEAEGRFAPPVSPLMMEQLRQAIDRRYPHPGASEVPTKIAVTALTGGEGDLGEMILKKPVFVTHQKMTAAMRGDAFHKYMLFARHEEGAKDPAAETARLVEALFLSPDEGKALDMGQLKSFYQSPLFGRVERAKKVFREYRFMTLLGSEELGGLFPKLSEDEGKVTVQGICDLLFLEEDGAVLVDYKTDRTDDPAVLLRRHAGQLRLYAAILGRILEVPVKECLIYSTSLGGTVLVPPGGDDSGKAG